MAGVQNYDDNDEEEISQEGDGHQGPAGGQQKLIAITRESDGD